MPRTVGPNHRVRQGAGIGSALIGGLEVDIRSAGYANADVETGVGNVLAIRFYDRRGYTRVRRGERFSPAPGCAIEKLRFSKAL